MGTHDWLGYFSDRFDCSAGAEPRRRYVILSPPRTGSNYVCGRLDNLADHLGVPMEYLHGDAIRALGARLLPGVSGAVGVDRYLDAVAAVRTTQDGWFGTKIQPAQLMPLFDGDIDRAAAFLRRFDRLIVLARHDRLGQAISGAIAHLTGVWFNFGEEPGLAERDIGRLLPVVHTLCQRYDHEDEVVRSLAARLGDRPVLHLSYEEIEADPDAAFRRVTAFLGFDPRQAEERSTVLTTRKPPGALAARIRAAYPAFAASGSGWAPGNAGPGQRIE